MDNGEDIGCTRPAWTNEERTKHGLPPFVSREKLIAALEFYADEKNWMSPSSGFALQYDPVKSTIAVDGGSLARDVLKGLV